TAIAVEKLVREHIAHANDGNVDAYIADFIPEHPQADVIRAFAERVLEQHTPDIEPMALRIEIAATRRGRVVVVQRTSYTLKDKKVVDYAKVTYHCRSTNAGWKLESTSRERLEDEAAALAEAEEIEKP